MDSRRDMLAQALSIHINLMETGSPLLSAQDLVNMGPLADLGKYRPKAPSLKPLGPEQAGKLARMKRLLQDLRNPGSPEFPENTGKVVVSEIHALSFSAETDVDSGDGDMVRVVYEARWDSDQDNVVVDDYERKHGGELDLPGHAELYERLKEHAAAVAKAWMKSRECPI